jgi:hypothetical protein
MADLDDDKPNKLVTEDDLEEGVDVDDVGGVIKVGFYGADPIAKQTGVAVSAGGVHAALVALGLITA